MTIHLYYTRNPFGRWSANLSATHPDDTTSHGKRIKYTGHRVLTAAEASQSLTEIAALYHPDPHAPPNPDPAAAIPPEPVTLRPILTRMIDVMTRAKLHGVTDHEWDRVVEDAQNALAVQHG